MRRLFFIAIIMLPILIPATARAAAVDVAPRATTQPYGVAIAADAAVRDAMHLRGVPYVWSGTTPAGFDCSGFTRYVYGKLGINLAHSSYAQWTSGQHIARPDLRPGDLVFFAGLGHVGIYIGGGRFIHAPHTGTVVSVDRVAGSWYGPEYDGAVRPRGASAAVLTPRGAATMAAWHSLSTPLRHLARWLRAASLMT